MRRLIGSALTLAFVGGLMSQGGLIGGSNGTFAQSSGPKRIVINPDTPNARPLSGHRFVSARTGDTDTSFSLPQTWSLGAGSAAAGGLSGGGLEGGITSGAHLPATVQAQLDQISKVDPSGLRDHGMGSSLSGFVSKLNAEMNALLANIDPSGGAASTIACWLPGREQFCPTSR